MCLIAIQAQEVVSPSLLQIDADFLAMYQANYGVNTTDSTQKEEVCYPVEYLLLSCSTKIIFLSIGFFFISVVLPRTNPPVYHHLPQLVPVPPPRRPHRQQE